jgi:hypothetical protein
VGYQAAGNKHVHTNISVTQFRMQADVATMVEFFGLFLSKMIITRHLPMRKRHVVK